jgi:hypothetical protein
MKGGVSGQYPILLSEPNLPCPRDGIEKASNGAPMRHSIQTPTHHEFENNKKQGSIMTMTLKDFNQAVVVMAHPDDEVLYASSILASAKKIIICYNQAPNSGSISQGRQTVFRDFPLKNAISLNIIESNTYQTTDWRKPVETIYGIHCGRNGDAYARNFHLLTAALEEHLSAGDLVISHNPWGEYGHEEHVQVFRAVADIRRKRDFRLFVSGYVSDRVLYFMQRNSPRLGAPSAFLPTDKALGARLMQHYQAHECWTWENGYNWPDYECFYEVTDPDAPLRADERTMSSLPVNVIWLDEHALVWSRALRRTKRRIGTMLHRLLRPAHPQPARETALARGHLDLPTRPRNSVGGMMSAWLSSRRRLLDIALLCSACLLAEPSIAAS